MNLFRAPFVIYSMAHPDWAPESAYERLRAEYDAEFGRLRTAAWELRLITQEASSDKVAEEAARQRVDQALGLYRKRRNNLAEFLTSH